MDQSEIGKLGTFLQEFSKDGMAITMGGENPIEELSISYGGSPTKPGRAMQITAVMKGGRPALEIRYYDVPFTSTPPKG